MFIVNVIEAGGIMKNDALRPLGEVTSDMEDLLLEMVCVHELQWGEVLNLIKGYLEVHCPDGQEQYEEGGRPVFYYGPEEKS